MRLPVSFVQIWLFGATEHNAKRNGKWNVDGLGMHLQIMLEILPVCVCVWWQIFERSNGSRYIVQRSFGLYVVSCGWTTLEPLSLAPYRPWLSDRRKYDLGTIDQDKPFGLSKVAGAFYSTNGIIVNCHNPEPMVNVVFSRSPGGRILLAVPTFKSKTAKILDPVNIAEPVIDPEKYVNSYLYLQYLSVQSGRTVCFLTCVTGENQILLEYLFRFFPFGISTD